MTTGCVCPIWGCMVGDLSYQIGLQLSRSRSCRLRKKTIITIQVATMINFLGEREGRLAEDQEWAPKQNE